MGRALLILTGLFVASLVLFRFQDTPPRISSSDQASFVARAGVEYALKKIYEGESPLTAGLPFANGIFRVSRNGRTLTVRGVVGDEVVTEKAIQPLEGNCLEIDTSESQGEGTQIRGITLLKKCLESVTLDKMIFSWDPDLGETYDRVRIGGVQNSNLYDAPPPGRSGVPVDLVNALLKRNERYPLGGIWFRDDMRGKSFRLTFVLGDGSEKETHFTLTP